jgi:hypothetical protein
MLVHYHIPKTAGTSVKRVLEAHFTLLRGETIKKDRASRPNFDDETQCITGHFASSLKGEPDSLIDSIPEIVSNPKLEGFTILRDPFEHLVSTYYHHRETSNKNIGKLIDFVKEGNRFMYRYSLNAFDAETIDACINSFFFIGDAGNLSASMDYLCDMLGKSRVAVPRQNVGSRDLQMLELTARGRARIEKVLAPEYELYEKVKDMIAKKGFTGDPASRQTQFAFVNDHPVDRTYFKWDETSEDGPDTAEPETADQNKAVEFVKAELLEIITIKDQKIAELNELIKKEKKKFKKMEEILSEKESIISNLKIGHEKQNIAMDEFRLRSEDIMQSHNEKYDALLANFNRQVAAMDEFRAKSDDIIRTHNEKYDVLLANFNRQAEVLNEFREKSDGIIRANNKKYDALLANFNRQAEALNEFREKSEENIRAHKLKFETLMASYNQQADALKKYKENAGGNDLAQKARYNALLAKFNEQGAALAEMRAFVKSQSLKIARLRDPSKANPAKDNAPRLAVVEETKQVEGETPKPSRKSETKDRSSA